MTAVRRLRPRVGPRIAARVPEGFDTRPYERFTRRAAGAHHRRGGRGHLAGRSARRRAARRAPPRAARVEGAVLPPAGHHPGAAGRFAARWGRLEHHPFVKHHVAQPEDAPEVLRLEKSADAKRRREHLAQRRHLARGARRSARCCAPSRCPPVGGDTLWADMGAAYDLLPTDDQGARSTELAVHDWIDTFGRGMDEAKRDALRPDFPPMEHPVVRTHPETGRRTLYVNGAFTQQIVGMDRDDGAELLRPALRPGRYPRVPVPLSLEARRRRLLGQPRHPALRRRRTTSPSAG